MKRNFYETEKHGYMIVDIETHKHIEHVKYYFLPFQSRSLQTVLLLMTLNISVFHIGSGKQLKDVPQHGAI